jgi:hypothetical protein
VKMSFHVVVDAVRVTRPLKKHCLGHQCYQQRSRTMLLTKDMHPTAMTSRLSPV